MDKKTFLYTEEHEWVSINEQTATIGITDFATDELGEIVYVELPEVASSYKKQDEFGVLESVKTVSSLFIPVNGEVIEKNNILSDNPGLVNESPYKDGWLIKLKVDNYSTDHLMSYDSYQEYLKTL
ncbi:glycine cleavage system protein GcvH [Candidatus Marinamargulisbacteria bacterium SCGC AG-410-N11]|nr:glycine cleavage system protein GcvH [Candidatus Marinamargulisbacteria bacterium SCGC AG-410-N11]